MISRHFTEINHGCVRLNWSFITLIAHTAILPSHPGVLHDPLILLGFSTSSQLLGSWENTNKIKSTELQTQTSIISAGLKKKGVTEEKTRVVFPLTITKHTNPIIYMIPSNHTKPRHNPNVDLKLKLKLTTYQIECFSIEYHKTKTKEIPQTNQNRCKLWNESIGIWNNYIYRHEAWKNLQ